MTGPCSWFCPRCPRAIHWNSLTVTRPRWHRDADGSERFKTSGTKLEVCAQWDGQTYSRVDINNLAAVTLLAPHLASTRNEVPDFLHGLVSDSVRYLARTEFKVGHSAAFKAKENPYIRSIGRDGVATRRQVLRLRVWHAFRAPLM